MISIVTLTQQSETYAMEKQMAQYQWDEAQVVVEELFDAVEKKDWANFTELICNEEQSFYEDYFFNEAKEDGIKQIDKVEVLNIYKVQSSRAEGEWLTEEYSVLQTSNEIYSFIVEADCKVVKENKYFFDGVNYLHVVVALENEELKVVQFNKPSTELLDEVVKPELSKSDDVYAEQVAGINAIEKAEQGLVVNAKQEIITEGFTTIEQASSNAITTFSADPKILSHYATYSYPTYIDVKLNKTGNNKIVRVSFTNYLKNVLPNEWIPSWNATALKVGAYCVKMVSIYRALNPMSSAGGYDLTQSTQMYKPNSTLYSSTSAAIDSIKNMGMATSNYCIFFPMYSAGTQGSVGTKASGDLKQWGSQKMATQGYSYTQILNYYYSGSQYSSGNLKLFSYNIGY